MSDRTCMVDRCDNPMPTGDNSTACPGCWFRLERLLAEMPDLVDQITVTLARQGAVGGRNGSRGTETPLPYSVAASGVLGLLTETMVPWVREGIEAHPGVVFAHMPDPLSLARGMLRLHGWLQGHPDGWQAIEEVGAAVSEAWRVVDRAPDRWYAGPCGSDVDGVVCTEELYGKPSAAVVHCRTCGTDHDVEERRAYLIDAARDRLVTTHEACRAVATYGDGNVSSATIRKWKERHRLVPHGKDQDGRDLWLLGDVIDLARTSMRTG